MADEEKTEDPTGKRLSDAQNEGNVAKSRELPTAALLLASAVFLNYYGTDLITGLGRIMRELLSLPRYDLTPTNVFKLLYFCVTETGLVVAPFFAVILVVAYVSNVMQVGFVFTPKALKFNLGALNPITGFSKFFSKRTLVELLKSLFKIFVIGYVAYLIIKNRLSVITTLADADLLDIFAFLGKLSYELVWKISLLALLLAIIDFYYQKYQHRQDLKMTKQEVKEEFKQMEGDPKIKSRIRKIQREMARKRMMEDVPKADVVITNPTHYAVALKYDPGTDKAPVCVAKGQRLIALRIREIAQASGVPVHEDPPVARSLFNSVDIGEEIPENLFKAVAAILSLVDKYKNYRQ